MQTTGNETSGESKKEQQKDAERKETNKTDPQLTELKGFIDPDEPLEEKGTPNPLTDHIEEGK